MVAGPSVNRDGLRVHCHRGLTHQQRRWHKPCSDCQQIMSGNTRRMVERSVGALTAEGKSAIRAPCTGMADARYAMHRSFGSKLTEVRLI